MITARIVWISVAALLGYAIYQVGTASDTVANAQIQALACTSQECATALDTPPSSSLFL
jgi:hypothetical protein